MLSTDVSNYTQTNGKGETGVSNTRLNSQTAHYEVSIDWLDFSLLSVSSGIEAENLVKDVAAIVGDTVDFSPTRATFNGKAWDGSGRGVAGLLVWWQAPVMTIADRRKDEDGNPIGCPNLLPPQHCPISPAELNVIRLRLPIGCSLVYDATVKYVTDDRGVSVRSHGWSLKYSEEREVSIPGVLKFALSGKVMARADTRALVKFLKKRGDIKASRIDVALDDMLRSVSMAEIKQAATDGNYFGCQFTSQISSGRRKEEIGETVYFGSTSSDKRLRVYDKTVESKGIKDCIRWEVEFRRAKATECFDSWLHACDGSANAVTDYLRAVVVGAIDFRDRSSDDPNRERCPLLSWWSDMLDRLKVAPIAVTVKIVAPTIQRSIDWLKRQVAPTLAAVSGVLESEFSLFMSELLFEGVVRLPNHKREEMLGTDKEQLCY